MPITLEQNDYTHITEIVRQKLRELISELGIDHGAILFGPEFLSLPLRISTPSTQFEFSKAQTEYIKNFRQEINNSQQTPEEKARKNQQLDSIILFGQLLFSQAASLHFLSQIRLENQNIRELQALINQESIEFSCSRFDTLSRRKKFKEQAAQLKLAIQESTLSKPQKQELLANLHKAQGFYYQINDLNFRYADKPSRSFSNFVRSYENYGSKVALSASIIAIGATALSLIAPLAPIMATLVVVASAISLNIGLPLAFKNFGTMLYNLIRFGAEPSPAELINGALLGTTILFMGAANAVQQAVGRGLIDESANLVTKGVTTANNLTKISVGIQRQIDGASQQSSATFFKKMKSEHPAPPDSGPSLTG